MEVLLAFCGGLHLIVNMGCTQCRLDKRSPREETEVTDEVFHNHFFNESKKIL
jgi:hypothetical protein